MKILVACILILFLTSCSYNNYIRYNDFDNVNDELLGKEIYLILKEESEPLYGRNLYLSEDSTFFFDINLLHEKKINTSELKKIIVTNYTVGALQGFIAGIASGAVFGIILGTIAEPNNDDSISRGLTKGAAFFAGLSGGILTGTIIGAYKGSNEVYIILK